MSTAASAAVISTSGSQSMASSSVRVGVGRNNSTTGNSPASSWGRDRNVGGSSIRNNNSNNNNTTNSSSSSSASPSTSNKRASTSSSTGSSQRQSANASPNTTILATAGGARQQQQQQDSTHQQSPGRPAPLGGPSSTSSGAAGGGHTHQGLAKNPSSGEIRYEESLLSLNSNSNMKDIAGGGARVVTSNVTSNPSGSMSNEQQQQQQFASLKRLQSLEGQVNRLEGSMMSIHKKLDHLVDRLVPRDVASESGDPAGGKDSAMGTPDDSSFGNFAPNRLGAGQANSSSNPNIAASPPTNSGHHLKGQHNTGSFGMKKFGTFKKMAKIATATGSSGAAGGGKKKLGNKAVGFTNKTSDITQIPGIDEPVAQTPPLGQVPSFEKPKIKVGTGPSDSVRGSGSNAPIIDNSPSPNNAAGKATGAAANKQESISPKNNSQGDLDTHPLASSGNESFANNPVLGHPGLQRSETQESHSEIKAFNPLGVSEDGLNLAILKPVLPGAEETQIMRDPGGQNLQGGSQGVNGAGGSALIIPPSPNANNGALSPSDGRKSPFGGSTSGNNNKKPNREASFLGKSFADSDEGSGDQEQKPKSFWDFEPFHIADIVNTVFDSLFIAAATVLAVLQITALHPQSQDFFRERDIVPWWYILTVTLMEVFTVFWMILKSASREGANGWMQDTTTMTRKKYLETFFKFDIIYALPLELCFMALPTVCYWLMTRHWLRWFRMWTIKESDNPFTPTRPLFAFLCFLGFIVLLHHIMASLAWAYFSPDAEGGDALDYLDALYWAVSTTTSTGYGDISPKTPGPRVMGMFSMILGALIVASTTAFATSILTNRDALEEEHDKKRKMMQSMLEHYQIPWGLRQHVITLFPHVLQTHSEAQFKSMMESLPPGLSHQLSQYVQAKMLKNVSVFKGLDDVARLLPLVERLQQRFVDPQEVIVRQGDDSTEMYFLIFGQVQVIRTDGDEELILSTLFSGTVFGEMGVIRGTKRAASIQAVTACELMVLTKEDFDEAVAEESLEDLIAAQIDNYSLPSQAKKNQQRGSVHQGGNSVASSRDEGSLASPVDNQISDQAAILGGNSGNKDIVARSMTDDGPPAGWSAQRRLSKQRTSLESPRGSPGMPFQRNSTAVGRDDDDGDLNQVTSVHQFGESGSVNPVFEDVSPNNNRLGHDGGGPSSNPQNRKATALPPQAAGGDHTSTSSSSDEKNPIVGDSMIVSSVSRMSGNPLTSEAGRVAATSAHDSSVESIRVQPEDDVVVDSE